MGSQFRAITPMMENQLEKESEDRNIKKHGASIRVNR